MTYRTCCSEQAGAAMTWKVATVRLRACPGKKQTRLPGNSGRTLVNLSLCNVPHDPHFCSHDDALTATCSQSQALNDDELEIQRRLVRIKDGAQLKQRAMVARDRWQKPSPAV